MTHEWHRVTHEWHRVTHEWHRATHEWHRVTHEWHRATHEWHRVTHEWHRVTHDGIAQAVNGIVEAVHCFGFWPWAYPCYRMTRFRWIVAISIAVVILVPIVAVMWRARGIPSITIVSRMFLLRMVLGIVFVLLGIIGAFVPIMQGWVFMLLAVLVLFPQSKFAVKVMAKAEPKLPRLCAWLRKLGIGERPHETES
ncbi:MAG TPA: hypothetical protein VF618_16420 [Thermoanaerobaculia bacterium]